MLKNYLIILNIDKAVKREGETLNRPRKAFVCSECGFKVPKWQGKCPSCGSWNTFEEQIETGTVKKLTLSDGRRPQKLREVESSDHQRFSTGIGEFDRVLGGGIVRDSLVIITAEPGSGKSTILTQMCNNVAMSGKRVLYISGEESEGQVKARSERILENISENIWIKSETCMDRVKEYIKELDPELVVIDSIQTMYLEEALPSRAGGPVQVMSCTDELMAIAKRDKRAIFIVGHLTKNNELAGVKRLEHMVDTVIYLEGDRRQQLRIMRAVKNRFGNTDEIGIFQMDEKGLVPIENPCSYFLTSREEDPVGCALTVSMEGTRPLIVEIESLVDKSAFGTPMRIAEGINRQQLQVLTAILEKRAKMQLGFKDVYVKVSGGLKLTEPAVNLGVLMAVASSYLDKPLDRKSVYIGEVGLTGDIKPVTHMERRLKELDRLGFKKAFIPKGNLQRPVELNTLQVVEVSNICELLENCA